MLISLLLAATATTAFATPLAANPIDSTLNLDLIPRSTNINLSTRGVERACHGNPATANGQPEGSIIACPPPAYQWQVYLPGAVGHYPQCGSGFLDNLRGQCGVISSWTCHQGLEGHPDDVYVQFGATIGCSEKNVQDAYWLAYQEDGLRCNLDKYCPHEGDVPDLDSVPDILKVAWQILRGFHV